LKAGHYAIKPFILEFAPGGFKKRERVLLPWKKRKSEK